MARVVADLGNSRLKWGRLAPDGTLEAVVALPNDDPAAWADAFAAWRLADQGSTWAISSVNPPVAERLRSWLSERTADPIQLFRSAAEIPVPHALDRPERTGVDRALAVLEALAIHPASVPGQVVSCGTAVTVERITPDGIWRGGAIAPGLGLAARALHQNTAQLPLISTEPIPAPWGASTAPAMAAGVFWGTVGAIRELLSRQAAEEAAVPWLVWTGGDAERLAPPISGENARIMPDLVLRGLARVAFGPEAEPSP